MVFQHRIQTRYVETAQDGIIHHSSYVVYLEEARLEFFKTLGCHINLLEQDKIFSPVVNLYIEYLKPLYSLEEIFVEVVVGKVSKVRFCLDYRILREDVCVAKGSTSECFVNALFKPLPIPQEFSKALQSHTSKTEKLLTSN